MIHYSEFLLKTGKFKGEKTSSFHPTGTIFLLSTRSPEFLTAIKLVDVTWDDKRYCMPIDKKRSRRSDNGH